MPSDGDMQLPAELRAKIEQVLGSDDRKSLANAATDISLKYRRETITNLQMASILEAKAYLATRLPATWCSVSEVLQKFIEIDPDFHPKSVLDLGAGPGTATLSAKNIWPDTDATLVEPNAHLRAIGQEIDPESNWKTEHLQNFKPDRQYDLVLSSYVLNEIESDLTEILEMAWKATSGAFVLIEPGTPQGYATILKARDYFLSLNANIAAPCPHHFDCPLKSSDRWCHFSVRVDRSKLHLQVKADARLSYEDEKFSYLVVTRQPTPKPRFRALGEPHGQKVVSLETCQSNGSFEICHLSKRAEDYKLIKKMEWGDAAP